MVIVYLDAIELTNFAFYLRYANTQTCGEFRSTNASLEVGDELREGETDASLQIPQIQYSLSIHRLRQYQC